MKKNNRVNIENDTILNRINDAVLTFDKEWRYTFLNKAALSKHPEGSEILGKHIWEIHPEIKKTRFWSECQEALRTGDSSAFEEYYPPMKMWVFIKVYPSDDGITLCYSDITTRKKAEQELALWKLRMEAILENTNDVIWAIDKNYNYIYFNSLAKHFIQSITGKEIKLGFHSPDSLPGKYKAEILSDCERALDGEQFVAEKERNYCGINVTEEYSFNPLRNKDNEVIGVSVFMKDITQQKKEFMKQKENELRYRALVKHSLQIREEEGKRIAREIHDELGQQLTGLKMKADNVRKKMGDADNQVKEQLSSMITIIDDTVKMVRRISSELRPAVLDDLGLIAALEWMGEDFERRTGVKVAFFTNQDDLPVDEHLSNNIFRIYQEALTNIMRYANATFIETTFEKSESNFVLIIKDNGIGFNLNEVKNKNSWGLIGMKERASFIKADFNISSAKGYGTIITLTIPLQQKKIN